MVGEGADPYVVPMTVTEREYRRAWDKAMKGSDAPWGSIPPAGSVLQGVGMTVRLSGRGYTGTATATWVAGTRLGSQYSPLVVMRQETRYRQDWPFAPSLGAVLRAHSRYAWDMSIGPLVLALEGQEALPGL